MDAAALHEITAGVVPGVQGEPSTAAEALRILSAAILDQHSVWWALASPLFALSVGPYLLFLRNLWSAPTATDEMKASFATLLLFVVVSIPAEAYTQEQYGTVLSNIDALHFLIQAAISLTNLRIMLAFRDGCRLPDGEDGILDAPRETHRGDGRQTTTAADRFAPAVAGSTSGWDGEGWDGRLNSGPMVSVDWGGGGDGGAGRAPGILQTAERAERLGRQLRPGQLVEAAAGIGLVATFGLMALDSRLAGFTELGLHVPGVDQAAVAAFVDAFRSWSASAAAAAALGQPPGPANALSVPTWGVHVFSLVEWLVAMGLVWEYAEVSGEKAWRTLTWGMLPLHASGVCACVQHFFFNAPDLEWLVTAQGALTMIGNSGMCFAAARLAGGAGSNVADSVAEDATQEAASQGGNDLLGTAAVIETTAHGVGQVTGVRKQERVAGAAAAGAWYNFDVEGFAPLWSEDGDAAFSTKIAGLSLAVAAVVRACSLAAGPHFADPGVYDLNLNGLGPTGEGGVDAAVAAAAASLTVAADVDGGAGEWVEWRGWLAGVMVTVPLGLNVCKWGVRQRGVQLVAADGEFGANEPVDTELAAGSAVTVRMREAEEVEERAVARGR